MYKYRSAISWCSLFLILISAILCAGFYFKFSCKETKQQQKKHIYTYNHLWQNGWTYFFALFCLWDRSSFCQWIASIQAYFPMYLYIFFLPSLAIVCVPVFFSGAHTHLSHARAINANVTVEYHLSFWQFSNSIPNRLHVFVVKYDWISLRKDPILLILMLHMDGVFVCMRISNSGTWITFYSHKRSVAVCPSVATKSEDQKLSIFLFG